MRNLVVTEFLSLDGVIEAPSWTFHYWNDEIAKFKGEETNVRGLQQPGRRARMKGRRTSSSKVDNSQDSARK
jgi:hypothetical protein